MTTNANTPEKSTTGDKCPKCGSDPSDVRYVWECSSYQFPDSLPHHQSDLCRAIEAKNRAEGIVQEQLAELERISDALGSNEGHSSVDHIIAMTDRAEKAEAELAEVKEQIDECVNQAWDKRATKAETQNAKLKGLLERANKHDSGCDCCTIQRPEDECNCEYREIRKELEAL